MRVAMIGWEFPPFMTGGLAVHCYELTRSLAEKGVEIDFFMPKTKNLISIPWMRIIQVDIGARKLFGAYSPSKAQSIKKNPGGESGEASGIEHSYGWSFFDEVTCFNNRAAELIAEMHPARKYDLIHSHDWIASKAGAAAASATGLPFIMTVHSTEYDRTAGLWPSPWIVNVEKEGISKAARVITVSKRLKQQLVERYAAPAEKIRVVYNAISWKNSDNFDRKRVKEMLGFREPVVLFHSRLTLQKGPEFFLRAAKRVLEIMPNTRFIVSGGGDMLPKLIELAVDLGIADKVLFTGQILLEKAPLIYAASDVYVLTSPSEPFGITVLEAMASRTPCVITLTTGVGEIVTSCLHAEYWDVDQIATKIIAVLRFPELKEELVENGAREVKQITWVKIAEETLKVYREVAVLA